MQALVPSIRSGPVRRLAWLGGLVLAALGFAAALASWPGPIAHLPAAAPVTTIALPAAPRRVGSGEATAQYLQFEPNLGQAENAVRYLSRGPRHSVEIFDDGLALATKGAEGRAASARLRFAGAGKHGVFEAREPGAGVVNYLSGSDSAAWIRSVPRYRQLRRANLYPGVDLVYYSRDGELEFDLVVRPGADASRIRMLVDGRDAPVIAANGDLLLDGSQGALRLHRPVLYQHIDGEKKTLEGQYVLNDKRELSFALPAYDTRYPLIIDPVFKLLYSTYLTGFHDEQVGGMTLDAQSNAYIVGQTDSDDFVVSGNAFQRGKSTTGLQYNVVVTKFDASGTLIYSTYLGGSGSDIGAAIAVDAAGNAYVTGNTTSRDFPVTADAQQPRFTGSPSAYLAVLSPDGSALVHSTFYGGSGSVKAGAIALDANGAAVIAGFADPGLVTTAGAYKTTLAAGGAAFVARFSAIAAGPPRLIAASYYGVDNPQPNATFRGNGAFAMALDASGAPWITGQAYTTNLPLTAGAVQAAPVAMSPTCNPGPGPLNSFAFVARLSADLSSLTYASYLTGATEPAGGAACSEFGRAIALDASGNVYVTGGTASAAFPTTAGAVQRAFPSAAGVASYTGFVSKLKADGSAILWSTYLGGNGGNTFPAALVIDAGANAVWTTSVTGGGSNYPITTDALQKVHGGGGADAGIVQLDATTGALKYSTFLGGSSADVGLALGVDAGGNAFVAGNTFSTNFPITANAYESAFRPDFFGGADWFFSVLGNGVIGTVRPPAGGNGGDATLSITGAGLQQGATCSLSSGTVSLGSSKADVTTDGTQASCVFALTGLAPGLYDVGVTNPDGSTLTKKASYQVGAGGSSNVEVDVIGRAVSRVGVPSDFLLTIRNTGSVDAYMVPLWITMSANVRYTITSLAGDPYAAVQPLADGEGAFSDAAATDPNEAKKVAFILPHLPAGYSGALRIAVLDTVLDDDFSLGAYTELPWFETRKEATDALTAYRSATSASAASCIDVTGRTSTSNCFGLWADLVAQPPSKAAPALGTGVSGGVLTSSMALVQLQQQFAATLLDALSTSGSRRLSGRDKSTRAALSPSSAVFAVKPVDGGVVAAFSAVLLYEATWAARVYGAGDLCTVLGSHQIPPVIDFSKKPATKWDLSQCVGGKRTLTLTFNCNSGPIEYKSDVKCPDPAKNKKKKQKKSKNQGSRDPNDKSGPEGGGGAAHAINADVALNYRVDFENVATAGLPAATVVVTDQLDPTKVDLTTLTLGPISWGSFDVDVPQGVKTYATVKPIDATLAVRIQGSLNPSTGLLKWTFTSIDPATGLPPSDPTVGFLPPDTDGIKGQGYVSFGVQQKHGLPDGTVFVNQASIVFDANAPIVTRTWTNTLDTTKPSSRVQSVTARSGTSSFDVVWAGSDVGSGIATFTVYVSDSAGPFTVWQTDVSTTTATFDGINGHVYGFYVIATDKAGNTEATKSVAEVSATADASSSGSGSGGGGCTIGGGSQRDASLPSMVLLAAAMLLIGRRRARPRPRRAAD